MKNKWFKRKSFYIPAVIVIVIILIFIYRSSQKTTEVSKVKVQKGDIVQEVNVSGVVKAKEAVLLAFEKGGRVRKINVSVGDAVSQGELLMSLENGVEVSAVEDAQAKLASKKAHYDDLKAGGRPEEVGVKESELAKAESDLATEEAVVVNLILDAYNKTDSAVRRQADVLFSNSKSANPKLNFNSADQQAVLDAENSRLNIEKILDSFKKLTQDAFDTFAQNEQSLAQAKNYLLLVNDFLIKTNRALDTAVNLSDSVLATDKDSLNTARTNINTAITNITDQIQSIATQKINVEKAKRQLELTRASATTEVLAGASADIASAEASVKNAEAILLKTYIISPINGIITKQDAKVGEIAGANAPLVGIMSGNFNIEAFVPEVDVAKITVGNLSTITLDAYGSEASFSARVVKIDPAETVIDGVSTYKTTLEFAKPDDRIRSGMTANLTIITANHTDALTVPQRAVFEKNGKKFVRIPQDQNNWSEREITTGIRGSSGEIEILSGLSENETVITSSPTK